MVVTSGKVRPSNKDNFFYRGVGIAIIVLLDWTVDAWKVAGRLNWSSRSMSVTLIMKFSDAI